MRILILANSDVNLYHNRKELIDELLKNNEVVIVLPDGELVAPLVKMGCTFVPVQIDRRGVNLLTDIGYLSHVWKILRRMKPDLVITYSIKPNVYGGFICRFLKIPYAVNITGLGTAFEKGGFLKALVKRMYKAACGRAKRVFFENEENRRLFVSEKLIRAQQSYVLSGAGVNLNEFHVMDYPEGDTVEFLFMGRVMAEKGVDELFEVMKRLVSEGVRCRLNIIGGCEENYSEKIKQGENEGWLTCYGYRLDVKPYIKSCHCSVLPSWHEGMANTNLESAAGGRPVITSDIPGCREAVTDHVTGLLVNRKDADSLYDAMLRFTEMPRNDRVQMGLRGRKHMEEMFDRDNVIRETIGELF